jgi:outer membrane protein TolC
MAAHADIDTARAGFCLASAAKTPDLQVGPYYQRTTDGTSFLGFRAQMDIPVINTGQPLEAQRHAELNQRATAWQQLSRRAELEATAAWERYRVAYTAVETNTTNVRLPEELQKLEEQFRAGEVDVLRIVQSRISLIQNQRTELDLRNELAQSAAALTAASGLPVEALLAPPLAE